MATHILAYKASWDVDEQKGGLSLQVSGGQARPTFTRRVENLSAQDMVCLMQMLSSGPDTITNGFNLFEHLEWVPVADLFVGDDGTGPGNSDESRNLSNKRQPQTKKVEDPTD